MKRLLKITLIGLVGFAAGAAAQETFHEQGRCAQRSSGCPCANRALGNLAADARRHVIDAMGD